MCIKGANNLVSCGAGVSIGADVVGGLLIGTGCVIGVIQGWHPLAISLIVTGGGIFVPGILGGMSLVFRVRNLEDKERESKEKISQALLDSGNL